MRPLMPYCAQYAKEFCQATEEQHAWMSLVPQCHVMSCPGCKDSVYNATCILKAADEDSAKGQAYLLHPEWLYVGFMEKLEEAMDIPLCGKNNPRIH